MLDTYEELIRKAQKRPKMLPNDYWNLILDNANLIFWQCAEHSKAEVAKDLGISNQEFTTIHKIVYAIASK